MTKTAKDVLTQHLEELLQPQRLDPIRERTARLAIESRVDQALKELEAIMQGVIDTGKLAGSSRGEENIGIILSTISVVTRQQRQALHTALHGEKK